MSDDGTIELEHGSGNVFEDLGLENAEELDLKAGVAGEVNAIIRHRRLTQAQASEILRIPQPKVSALVNGRLRGFSAEKLMGFLALLGRDVEITVKRPRARKKGRITLSTGNEKLVATG